jgi:CheY-like chemotaxis protein
MMTNAVLDSRRTNTPSAASAQKVVIVNGSSEILELFDGVLDAGHYDVVFVESSDHAYSQIKRVRPDLVILCVRVDRAESLQVLSMLKLDAETRHIPTLTYAATGGSDESDEEVAGRSETEMFARKPAAWMN